MGPKPQVLPRGKSPGMDWFCEPSSWFLFEPGPSSLPWCLSAIPCFPMTQGILALSPHPLIIHLPWFGYVCRTPTTASSHAEVENSRTFKKWDLLQGNWVPKGTTLRRHKAGLMKLLALTREDCEARPPHTLSPFSTDTCLSIVLSHSHRDHSQRPNTSEPGS